MITAVFETLDHCVRTAHLREAPAVFPVALYEPPQSPPAFARSTADADFSRKPAAGRQQLRVYKRQWVRDSVAYYREEWRDDA